MKEDRAALTGALEELRVHRGATYELLDALSDEQLHRKWQRPGLDTFAKHFLEMASVQRAFAEALRSGALDFSKVPGVFDFPAAAGREEIRAALEEGDEAMESAVGAADPGATVDWGDGIVKSAEAHLAAAAMHEVLHHGMGVTTLYAWGLPIPRSLGALWSLPATQGAR